MTIIILTSIIISLIFAPLGCLVLWKRYIYFGDGIAHASLLAGSLAILAHIPVLYCGLMVAALFAFAVFKFKNVTGNNGAISLVSNVMLAISLVMTSLNSAKININNLLFGDILAASKTNLIALVFLLLVIIGFFLIFYRKIIILSLNRDIAKIQSINVDAIELGFLILLSLSIFLTIQIVGALLVTSVLLIPSMTARLMSKSPLQMIIFSLFISVICNILGLAASFYLDIPVAASIIIVGAMLYFATYCFYAR